MSELAPGRARYLESLSRLQRSWAHETRSHLGNVSLQLELLNEHLKRGGLGDGEKLRAPMERARQGVARLERCLDRYLGAAVPRGPRSNPLDVASLLAEIDALVEPFARERQVRWSVAGAVTAGIPDEVAEAVRESLATLAIGIVAEAGASTAVELRAEAAGPGVALRLTRGGDGPAPEWLDAARAALQGTGIEMRVVSGATPALELALPATATGR